MERWDLGKQLWYLLAAQQDTANRLCPGCSASALSALKVEAPPPRNMRLALICCSSLTDRWIFWSWLKIKAEVLSKRGEDPLLLLFLTLWFLTVPPRGSDVSHPVLLCRVNSVIFLDAVLTEMEYDCVWGVYYNTRPVLCGCFDVFGWKLAHYIILITLHCL